MLCMQLQSLGRDSPIHGNHNMHQNFNNTIMNRRTAIAVVCRFPEDETEEAQELTSLYQQVRSQADRSPTFES